MALRQLFNGLLSKLTYQGVAKNTIYQLIGKVFTAISTLIIVRLVTSHYGQSGAGDLTLILNFLNIFYLLADFGVNAIAVKQMVEHPDQESSIFRSLYGLRLLSGLVLTAIAVIVVTLLPFDPATNTGFSPIFKTGIYFLSLTILTQGVYLTATAVFQKRKSYGAPVAVLATGSVVTLLVFLYYARQDMPLTVPLVGYLIGGLMTATLAVFLLPYVFKEKLLPTISKAKFRSLLLPSLPIATTLVLNVIYFKSDSFVLASLMPREDVGIYGVAYKIFDQGIVVPVFFVNALYPLLLEQYTNGMQKLKKTLLYGASLLLLGGLSLGLLEIILAPWLVHLVAKGENFSAAIVPLRILAAGLPFFFVSNLFLWLLITLGKQKYLIFIYGTSMIFNVVANIVFIPHYSYIASAILTGVSEGIVLALTMGFGLYFLNRKLKESSTLSS